MSLFYCVINWSLDTSGILLRCLHAGGEELDEFGAVVAKGGERLVRFDELGIAQEFEPVLRLGRFLESDLKLRRKVGLALRYYHKTIAIKIRF